jgi:hypothetical protein
MLDFCPHFNIEWLTCRNCEVSDEPHDLGFCPDCGVTLVENY